MQRTDEIQVFPKGGVIQRSNINARNAVRYGKMKNKAELYSTGFFLFAKPFAVELHDVSSRGAKIATQRRLPIGANFMLKITFSGGKVFEIPGKAIRHDSKAEHCYGFKFNAYNDKLGDYLFRSQTERILNIPQ